MTEKDGLFPVEQAGGRLPAPLTPRSTLTETMAEFNRYMRRRNLSDNTIKAFQYDLNILMQYLGKRRAVGDIGLRDLQGFVDWLQHERGVPCNIKSLGRRITTLKVFFGWLAEAGVLPNDPAAPLVQVQVSTPLPDILTDDEVAQLLATTDLLRHAARPDARPHVLVTLLLSTGIKKSECANLVVNHLDFSDSARPAVWIRYANPRYRLKERKLKLDPSWPTVFEEYRAQYKIRDKIFPWTPRNLEYVLRDAGMLAGLTRQVSFEMLRWTCAVRDYKAGMPPDDLRRKLGLAPITWREAGEKIARLATPPL